MQAVLLGTTVWSPLSPSALTDAGDPSSQPHIHALPGCADSSLHTDPGDMHVLWVLGLVTAVGSSWA